MALVLYEPTPILQVFHEQQRVFNIPGLPHNVTINQDWNSHGVAAVVWEAAVVLATYLQTISATMSGKRVLELGSGTGMSGIAACMLGAEVTFTDLEGSLDVCLSNIELNLNSTRGHSYEVKPLNWCQDLKTEWGGKKFDFIIGADLIYIEDVFEDLVRTIGFFMGLNEDTVMYLSGKIRYEERYGKFRKMLDKKFAVELVYFDEGDGIYILKITPL